MPYGTELNRLAVLWAEQPGNHCFAALAEALRKRGALADAAAVATAGVTARPDFLPGHIVLARIRGDQQQWAAAVAELEAALRLDPAHPLALEARDAATREDRQATPAASADPSEGPDDEPDALVYADEGSDEAVASGVAEPVLTESLAMLYHGQGHTADALEVMDALVARSPGNRDLAAKRDAMRAELVDARSLSGGAVPDVGIPVRHWLAALANAPVPPAPPASSFDAFFQAPAALGSADSDLAAFQAWLRELER